MPGKLAKFNDQSYAHYITTKTFNNSPYFKDNGRCRILANNIEFYERKYNLEIYGYIILPDHLHLVLWWDTEKQLTLTISKVIQGIKGVSARQIIDYLKREGRLEPLLQSRREQRLSSTHRRGLKYQIWQFGFYDFNICSQEKLLEKLQYMANNPERLNLVNNYKNYPWLYLRYPL